MAEMTSMSRGQRNYLRKLRRDSQIVRIIRILIFLAFLALWEGSARLGLIDSFIFSSPSQVVMAMYHMILDGTLAVHTGVTLWETIASFALVTVFGIAIAVLFPEALIHFGTVSGSPEQPAKISPGTAFDRVAGQQY